MVIEQIVEIPADRHLRLDVALPEAAKSPVRVIMQFPDIESASVETAKSRWTPEPPLPRVHTLEEAIAQAEAQAVRRMADPSIPLFNGMGGCLKDSKTFDGDPVAIQREMRNEWPD
jgi:hypothetical protein